MKKNIKKAIVIILIANCFLIAIAICGTILSRFHYEDHLDDVVITVDDSGVSLREFGYYIFEVEAFVQNQALLYDPENPKLWWNTHFSAGLDSQFVCDYAKKVAIYTCTADEIYYEEAISQGMTLSIAEEEAALTEAGKKINSMTSEQMSATGLNEEIIIAMSKKHALASKYAGELTKEIDMSAYSDDPAKLVNWDGAYYQNEILPRHSVKTNDKVLDKITLGKITVNME